MAPVSVSPPVSELYTPPATAPSNPYLPILLRLAALLAPVSLAVLAVFLSALDELFSEPFAASAAVAAAPPPNNFLAPYVPAPSPNAVLTVSKRLPPPSEPPPPPGLEMPEPLFKESLTALLLSLPLRPASSVDALNASLVSSNLEKSSLFSSKFFSLILISWRVNVIRTVVFSIPFLE